MIGSADIFSAAHLFDPARLTLARELRGLTKTEVSKLIGKSPSAVSQFESGRARPDTGTLRRLSLSLGMPITFFTRRRTADLIPLDVCHFRSLRSASQRSRRRLLAAGTLLSELVAELDSEVEFPPEGLSELAQEPQHSADIDRIATTVRNKWRLGLGPVSNMITLLESKGVIVAPIMEGCREVDAFSLWHSRRPLVFLVLDKESTSRARFDAAHELGHLIMHADVVPGNRDVERQADRFASAFLLPRESFGPECPQRLVWPHFHELKKRWKVSLWALARRAYELGKISQASYRRACVQLNKKYNPGGARRQEPHEPQREMPTLIRQALSILDAEYPIERLAETLAISARDVEALFAPSDGQSP